MDPVDHHHPPPRTTTVRVLTAEVRHKSGASTRAIFAPLVTGYLADSAWGWGGVFVVAGAITIIGPVLLLFAGRR